MFVDTMHGGGLLYVISTCTVRRAAGVDSCHNTYGNAMYGTGSFRT